MLDHLHLLVETLADQSHGLKFIARAKQFSGFYYRKERSSRILCERDL
jgi:hypothetical protein